MSGDFLLVSSRCSPQRSCAEEVLGVLRVDLDRFAPALAGDITGPVLPASLDSTTSAEVLGLCLVQKQKSHNELGLASDIETSYLSPAKGGVDTSL